MNEETSEFGIDIVEYSFCIMNASRGDSPKTIKTCQHAAV